MDEEDVYGPTSTTTSGRVKTSITLPRWLWRRTRRAADIEKRDMSRTIEAALEEYLDAFEKARGLTSNHLRDDWPD